MKLSEIAKIGEIMDVKVGEVVARAKIERMLEPNGFVIGYPTYKLVPLPIQQDEPCDFWFMRENGIFTFAAKLENEFKTDDIRYCAFKVITPITRKQRREAFRLPICLDVSVRLTDEEGETPAIRATTVDLSQNGTLIVMGEPLEVGARIKLSIKLFENVAFMLNATVIRCEVIQNKKDEYHVATQFSWDKPKEQAVLSRYIFQKQVVRRMAKKDVSKEEEN